MAVQPQDRGFPQLQFHRWESVFRSGSCPLLDTETVFRRRTLNRATLGIASLVLLAVAGMCWRQWEQYHRAIAEAERSHQTVSAIDSVLAALTDAETGQRGFLLTGENRYLEPYNRAVQELPNDLASLKKLVGGTPSGREEFETLHSLAGKKLDELRQTIAVRQTQGLRAAVAIVVTNEGQRTMDSVRSLCAQMRRNENASQSQASAGAEAAADIALLLAVAGSLVLLSLFAFGLEPFATPDPQAWQRSWLLRYGAAILAVVAIALMRAALTPLIGPTNFPFTMFFFAVAFAAWFGGFGPAMVSMILSLLVGSWFFAAPTASLLVRGHDDQVAMLMIVVVGFGMALLSRSQRSAVDRAVRAEDSERNERQRFETTLASIGDAVVATDQEGRVRFANKIALSLMRCTEAEITGKPLREVLRLVNESTRGEIEDLAVRVLREGAIVGLANHTLLIARDGTEVPIDDSAAPIRNPQGETLGVVLVFRDVSERRQAEQQLAEQARLLGRAAAESRSQRERLGLALTAGKMGVYEVNPVENTFWWSAEAYSLFGVNPHEFKPTRHSFAALIHPVDREPFMQYWDENIAEYQPINHEFRIVAADGKERWISCRGVPKYDDSGLPILYSGLFLDTTERKEAEKVLRQFEKLSAAARLSAAIAHEINNPLGAATNLVYLAKQTPGVPAPVVEQLALVEQELELVAHGARQALGFYRETSRAERIDIPELIESVVKIFSTRMEGRRISVVRGFLPGAAVYAVRGEIRQAISNLLANAIEAVGDGGTISLGTQTAGAGENRTVEIMIADDGHGIAAEHLDHIFEPFFTTKSGTGAGLGLWVAKQIIERHQGTIEVRPAENGSGRFGTTFTVRLPAEPGARVSGPPIDSSANGLERNVPERPSAGSPPAEESRRR